MAKGTPRERQGNDESDDLHQWYFINTLMIIDSLFAFQPKEHSNTRKSLQPVAECCRMQNYSGLQKYEPHY